MYAWNFDILFSQNFSQHIIITSPSIAVAQMLRQKKSRPKHSARCIPMKRPEQINFSLRSEGWTKRSRVSRRNGRMQGYLNELFSFFFCSRISFIILLRLDVHKWHHKFGLSHKPFHHNPDDRRISKVWKFVTSWWN